MRLLRADEIEVRVGTIGQGKSGGYATLLLYKDARTDMQMLDETFGAMNWQKDYKEIKGNLYCGIGRELYTAPAIYTPVAVVPDPYNKGKVKMADPRELRGMYVSRITYDRQRKIKDLDISIKGIVIWSTDKKREGLKHE